MAVSRSYFHLAAHQRPSVGDTKTSVVELDHMGWLKCDGRLLNVTDWKFLFDVVGYKFGSNTSNQFRLPDPAGRVAGYVGSGSGLTSRLMGATVGAETHTLTINEMPAHTHGASNATGNNDGSGITSASGSAAESELVGSGSGPNVAGSSNHTHTIGTTGGGAAHNNMQPTLFVGNMFIYSGKSTYGSNPFTAGIYIQATPNVLGSNLV
jgi:microcystin-dependent protein